jgi:hypothetical protein
MGKGEKLECTPKRMSEKYLIRQLPTGDPPKSPLKKGDFDIPTPFLRGWGGSSVRSFANYDFSDIL